MSTRKLVVNFDVAKGDNDTDNAKQKADNGQQTTEDSASVYTKQGRCEGANLRERASVFVQRFQIPPGLEKRRDGRWCVGSLPNLAH